MRAAQRAGAVAVVGGAAYALLRPQLLRWGATDTEVMAPLPGDDLIADPSVVTTRAITVEAAAGAVWPWLVQMGQGRGGFYSYDWLENLFGLDFHSADEIIDDLQALGIGDQLRTAPDSAGPEAGFTVVRIDPGRAIVTAVGDPAKVVPLAARPPMPDGGTWVFVLEPLGAGRCRLIVRLRARFGLAPPVEWLVGRLLEPVHFVMERKQLLGIEALAERSADRIARDRPHPMTRERHPHGTVHRRDRRLQRQ